VKINIKRYDANSKAVAQTHIISDIIAENYDELHSFKDKFYNYYRTMVRMFPNDLMQEIRSFLLYSLSSFLSDKQLKLKITIDTNIIVMDSIRVANGGISSTSILLGSPYIDVFAPPNIEREVTSALEDRFKNNPAKLKVALSHAKSLLSKVRIVSLFSPEAINLASSALSNIDKTDVPFLAVAIETRSEAILSHDIKAFGTEQIVRRWDIKDFANIVLNYHEGSLAIVVMSTTLELALKAFAGLMAIISNIIQEIISIMIKFLKAIISGSLDVISKIPKWFLVFISVGIVFAALLSKSFRNQLNEVLSSLRDIAMFIAKQIFNGLKIIWNEIIKPIIKYTASLIEQIAPYLLIVLGVLMDKIFEFLSYVEQEHWI
jgi:predicted nucleic acid-binding protein